MWNALKLGKESINQRRSKDTNDNWKSWSGPLVNFLTGQLFFLHTIMDELQEEWGPVKDSQEK